MCLRSNCRGVGGALWRLLCARWMVEAGRDRRASASSALVVFRWSIALRSAVNRCCASAFDVRGDRPVRCRLASK